MEQKLSEVFAGSDDRCNPEARESHIRERSREA